ncbi:Bacterial regulatory protein, tetR family [compost metagenome]
MALLSGALRLKSLIATWIASVYFWMKKTKKTQLSWETARDQAENEPLTPRTNFSSNAFEVLQSELLAAKERHGQRAPGRVRVDRIIEATIELLNEHKPADISIAMIADHAAITRTSIYSHFNSVDEVLEQIAIRFVQQTGVEVERYVSRRKPASLEELVVLMIAGIQKYFNQPNPEKPGALARRVPFESRHLIREFDKVAALPYHTLWQTGWDVEPLSEEDPFRTLVIIQSAIFETSIQRHGKITDSAVKQATEAALDFIARAEARYGGGTVSATPEDRILVATKKLATHESPALMELAASQIELLASTATKLSPKPRRQRKTN